mmetsp:Transcript_41990/g.119180  ORF Transcript_41990/g.119180 Transcript_41990/m.119180 type:complete len:313 (-) Transcript_41990:2223-3161(-)
MRQLRLVPLTAAALFLHRSPFPRRPSMGSRQPVRVCPSASCRFVDPDNDKEWVERNRSLPGYVRLVCISDTHSQHGSITTTKSPEGADDTTPLPLGDVLIHAGDWTMDGEPDAIKELSNWLAGQPYEHKVVIAGNHDLTFDTKYYPRLWRRFHDVQHDCEAVRASLQHCTYLEDSGTTVKGLTLWGSPWTPTFFDWGFNLDRGEEISEKWQLIPDDVDVLITHGPSYQILDFTKSRVHAGCADLKREIQGRIKPRLNIYGHIHEGRGVAFDGTTVYVNAASVDLMYRPIWPPFVIDVPLDRTKPIPLHFDDA